MRIARPTHSFASSGGVITDAATLSIDGGPTGGTNTTLTNSHAIYLPTWSAANTTNANTLTIVAPTGGATSNYALNTIGLSQMNGIISGGTKFTASGCSNSTTVGGATAGTFASGTTGACTVTITMNGATERLGLFGQRPHNPGEPDLAKRLLNYDRHQYGHNCIGRCHKFYVHRILILRFI